MALKFNISINLGTIQPDDILVHHSNWEIGHQSAFVDIHIAPFQPEFLMLIHLNYGCEPFSNIHQALQEVAEFNFLK